MRRRQLLGKRVSQGGCKLSCDVWYLAGHLSSPQPQWALKCRIRGCCGGGLGGLVVGGIDRSAGTFGTGKVGQGPESERTLLATGAISRVQGAGQ